MSLVLLLLISTEAQYFLPWPPPLPPPPQFPMPPSGPSPPADPPPPLSPGTEAILYVRNVSLVGWVEPSTVGTSPWLLVLNYYRAGGSNVWWDRTRLPTSPLDSSHQRLSEHGLTVEDVHSVRYYCRTSNHDRVIDFATTNAVQKNIVVLGSSIGNSPASWSIVVSPDTIELFSDHTAHLPTATNVANVFSWADVPDPLVGGSYDCHDGTFGDSCSGGFKGHRWGAGNGYSLQTYKPNMCDDGEAAEDSLHQIWVRLVSSVTTAQLPPSPPPSPSPPPPPPFLPGMVPFSPPPGTPRLLPTAPPPPSAPPSPASPLSCATSCHLDQGTIPCTSFITVPCHEIAEITSQLGCRDGNGNANDAMCAGCCYDNYSPSPPPPASPPPPPLEPPFAPPRPPPPRRPAPYVNAAQAAGGKGIGGLSPGAIANLVVWPLIGISAVAIFALWWRQKQTRLRRSPPGDAEHMLAGLELREAPQKTMTVLYRGEATLIYEALCSAHRSVFRGQEHPRLEGMRFSCQMRDLIMGHPKDSALGVHAFLRVPTAELRVRMNRGVAAIEEEIAVHGTDSDRECLRYVLHMPAGSSPLLFPNSQHPRDHSRNGETFFDFVAHPSSKAAGLSVEHVLALRLYTTACYQSINGPLRDRNRTEPHPFAATVAILNEGIKLLRAVNADSADANRQLDMWRGMRDVHATDEFERQGGTELAVMSATVDLDIAVQYAASNAPLLFKLTTSSFMNRGADLAFLSAFPNEKEFVFPPLTYLEPTGVYKQEDIDGVSFTIAEVIPHFAS
jgi:hypothetical protein